MSNIQPLGNNVLLKRFEEEAKVGALILPDSHQIENQGIVVAVGPNVSEVAPNQRVLFNSYGGKFVKYQEQEMIMIPEEEILGVFETMEDSDDN